MAPPDAAFRLDCHVHTRHSKDARGSVLDLAVAAQAAGLGGFCLTDHDTVAGHAHIREAQEKTGLLIVPAIEVTSAEGHILALGVREDVPRGLGYLETREHVEDQGGVAVPAHPLRSFSGMGPRALHHHTDEGQILAVEAVNARERRLVQQNTRKLVSELGVSPLGGSDAHWVHDVGAAYTVLDDAPGSVDDVLDAIRRGACRAEGTPLRRLSVLGHTASLWAGPLRRRFIDRQEARRP